MKKQLLTLALLTAIAAPSAFAVDSETAAQSVTVSVPRVALLNIGTTAPSFTCATSTAGENLSCTGTNNQGERI